MGREGPASREDSLIPTLPRFLYFLLLSWGLVGAGGVGVSSERQSLDTSFSKGRATAARGGGVGGRGCPGS